MSHPPSIATLAVEALHDLRAAEQSLALAVVAIAERTGSIADALPHEVDRIDFHIGEVREARVMASRLQDANRRAS